MIRSLPTACLLFLLFSTPAFAESSLVDPGTVTYKKAKDLIIAEINFNEVTLSDAIAFFKKESVAADPEKNGLNFIVQAPADPSAKEPFVSMTLRKVPLSEALKYVATMTNYRVKFDEQAIILIPPESLKKTVPAN